MFASAPVCQAHVDVIPGNDPASPPLTAEPSQTGEFLHCATAETDYLTQKPLVLLFSVFAKLTKLNQLLMDKSNQLNFKQLQLEMVPIYRRFHVKCRLKSPE